MNAIGKELTRDLQEKNLNGLGLVQNVDTSLSVVPEKFRSNYFHKECLGKLRNIPIIRPTSSEH